MRYHAQFAKNTPQTTPRCQGGNFEAPVTLDYQTEARMALKRQAIPLPNLAGMTVLDVGCDHGYWSRLASEMGASRVLGLDRNRVVKGVGHVDLIARNRAQEWPRCSFEHIDLGKEWREFGRFDVVFLFSLYHHIFENCGDHAAIWMWLARHVDDGGLVLWENPVDATDSVVQRNVSSDKRQRYTREAILDAAQEWFKPEYVGPALHEPTREVWRFRPVSRLGETLSGTVEKGAGGASVAFMFDGHRRTREIEHILGFEPFPGSLNVRLDAAFDWARGYYPAALLDVKDRKKGLGSEWAMRPARFYPVRIRSGGDWQQAFAFRFDGERYAENFVELIAPVRLRSYLTGEKVTLWR